MPVDTAEFMYQTCCFSEYGIWYRLKCKWVKRVWLCTNENCFSVVICNLNMQRTCEGWTAFLSYQGSGLTWNLKAECLDSAATGLI